jgi:transcriptional regulator with XRE-family HTH domain
VAIRDDIQARRWLGGVELTNYRARTALKQATVADILGVSAGLVSHFEQGKVLPEPEQIRAMLDAYGASPAEIERLVEFAGRPTEPRSWLARWDNVIAPFMRRFLGCEGFATRQFRYAPLVLPALVQTERYSAAMTAPSARVRPDQERRLVDLRMARQDRLRDGDLRLTAVIEETVLDRPVGDTETMREQLVRLRELADQPNIDLLIIPTAVGRHDGLEGRFTILHFETASGERQAGPVVYVEIPNDAVYKTNQDQVAAYTESAELIVSAALSQAESINAIEARLAA